MRKFLMLFLPMFLLNTGCFSLLMGPADPLLKGKSEIGIAESKSMDNGDYFGPLIWYRYGLGNKRDVQWWQGFGLYGGLELRQGIRKGISGGIGFDVMGYFYPKLDVYLSHSFGIVEAYIGGKALFLPNKFMLGFYTGGGGIAYSINPKISLRIEAVKTWCKLDELSEYQFSLPVITAGLIFK